MKWREVAEKLEWTASQIRSYTTLSEEVDPQDAILNSLYDIIVDIEQNIT